MGFLKKMKKKALKIFNPIMGEKVGDALFGKDKKAAPGDPGTDVFGNPLQSSEFYQSELEKEGANWRGHPDAQVKAVKEASQRAGTFADTREGNASIAAEAGARSRGLQEASLARINLLRKQLGLPESASV